MEIQELDRALILVIVMAFLILVQTVILVVGFSKLNQALKSLDQASGSIVEQARVATRQVNAILPKISGMAERLPALRTGMLNFIEASVETGRRADQAVAQALALSRVRVQQATETMDTVLSRFSQQTFRVHRAVLHPTLRLSAFLHGVFSGLGRLISGGPESPASHLPDSEDFV
jgi:uncharacterized protein YoxC